jgi:hypothetical protein
MIQPTRHVTSIQKPILTSKLITSDVDTFVIELKKQRVKKPVVVSALKACIMMQAYCCKMNKFDFVCLRSWKVNEFPRSVQNWSQIIEWLRTSIQCMQMCDLYRLASASRRCNVLQAHAVQGYIFRRTSFQHHHLTSHLHHDASEPPKNPLSDIRFLAC